MTSEELQKLLDEAPLPGWQVRPSVPESGFECYRVYDADGREIGAVNGPHNAKRAAIAALWVAAPDAIAELIRVRQERDELREALGNLYAAASGYLSVDDPARSNAFATIVKWLE